MPEASLKEEVPGCALGFFSLDAHWTYFKPSTSTPGCSMCVLVNIINTNIEDEFTREIVVNTFN